MLCNRPFAAGNFGRMYSDESQGKRPVGSDHMLWYASIVSLQSFLIICVATGIAPNTGTPLPFVSYGLTSLVSLYIGMGLVLNVGLQSSAYNKEIRKSTIDKKEDYL